uniref:Ubiquitin-like domain-containing protein n=1 Tax=Heterorhabditis bacteriophora TaxID=37862 RepID=A0A1I7X4I1_HETBA
MIFVKTLSGRTLTLDVQPLDTVRTIKSRIETIEGINAEEQRLMYAGRQLADDDDVQEASTLHLSLRLERPFNLRDLMSSYVISLNLLDFSEERKNERRRCTPHRRRLSIRERRSSFQCLSITRSANLRPVAMGKKVKIGKQRRDKYYKLAKESNSIITGVDLVPIKPIANCIALQGDITSEKTRQAIKTELQRWEVKNLLYADCVLHDGAPNVGLNWAHDAFQQNCLVLSALKLTTQILKKGGTFVTKVFRSNDYSCLIATFEKLFKRVHVWKPAASRLESAEIFVVCEKYLKPPKVFCFQAILCGRTDKKAKAEGYDDETLAVYKKIDATTFIQSHNYLDILGSANEIIIDQEKWKNSSETSDEVCEYLRDLKVCGPRELRTLLRWRKSMRKILEEEINTLNEENGEEDIGSVDSLNEDEIEDREMAEIDEMIAKATKEEKAELKKYFGFHTLLELVYISNKIKINFFKNNEVQARELNEITRDPQAPDNLVVESDEDSGDMEGEWETRVGTGTEDDRNVNDVESDDDNELIHTEESGLSNDEKKENQANKWFQKEEIARLLSDDDDDDDMTIIEKHIKKHNKNIHENTVFTEDFSVIFDEDGKKKKRNSKCELFDGGSEEEMKSDHNMEEIRITNNFAKEMDFVEDEYEDEDHRVAKREPERTILGEDLQPQKKKRRLTPEQLAMAEKLIYSSKSSRELEEWGWNRYANNDEGLPDWFVEDERKHYRKTPPVTKAQVQAYRERLRELNARPCKKVAEAKARKQRKTMQRLQKAKKKAEGILENENLEHSEKIREMRKIYAQAAKKDNKKVELVVMTKAKKGKMTRPNGKYKLVDSRMKKDLRAMKSKERTKRRGKKVKGKGRH